MWVDVGHMECLGWISSTASVYSGLLRLAFGFSRLKTPPFQIWGVMFSGNPAEWWLSCWFPFKAKPNKGYMFTKRSLWILKMPSEGTKGSLLHAGLIRESNAPFLGSLRADCNGYGSKLYHQATKSLSPCFHLPGFHFGYLF